MVQAIQHYVGTGKPMARFPGIIIPEGSDPGEIIRNHPILGSEIAAVPMMRASFKSPTGTADVGERYMVRVADDHPLGVVGTRYKALQPADIADLLSKLHKAFGLQFQTAMLLEDGQTFLTQANLKQIDLGPLAASQRAKMDTGGRDLVRGFLTIADNYTGKRNATAGCAMTRAVCENTAAAAMDESGKNLYGKPIRHTGDVAGKMEAWEHAISDSLAAIDRFEAFAQTAVQVKMPHDVARAIIETLVPLPVGAGPGKAQAKRDAIFTAFDNGIGNFGKTAWDLYNGVTEWANWTAPVRADNGNVARLESILWDGLGETIQQAEQHIRVFVGL